MHPLSLTRVIAFHSHNIRRLREAITEENLLKLALDDRLYVVERPLNTKHNHPISHGKAHL